LVPVPNASAAVPLVAPAIVSQMQESVTLLRASVGERPSAARATLEDYGMLARALLHLGLVTGEVRYAVAGRALVDATLAGTSIAERTAEKLSQLPPFAVPGGA